MYRALFFLCFIFFSGAFIELSGQISDGGNPLDVAQLKSTKQGTIEMPRVDNFKLLKQSVEEMGPGNQLKPFRFAHTFKVDINPKNSGEYFENIKGYNVWQVKIKSQDALSLNVIFAPYHVPQGARLFLFNEDKTQKLGAFTSFNNKSFGTLAVSPLAGDEMIIQYEEPVDAEFKGEIGVSKINHDFYGVVATGNERRPLGKNAGSCNIDINCDLADDWATLKNSVCRIFIEGNELCTGNLVNNTALDETPYVLTANHCFKDHVHGEQNSIFLFNYQSPYCGALDGDNSQSISGSILKASFDSLDFFLVELTLVPPPEYRPYYAGWDHSGDTPSSAVSIHHPVGDIKKIAVDYDSPVIDSFRVDYRADSFWHVLRWDLGTTEAGSSGGGFFDQDNHLVGTLTGGNASCSNSINDYFACFHLGWDYFEEPEKQLKHWLDPQNSTTQVLDGLAPYEGADFCDAFTNMQDGDTHQLVSMSDSENNPVGYWSGSNGSGITEFVDKFSIEGDETLQGIALGIGLLEHGFNSNGSLTLKVYNGSAFPEELIYSQEVPLVGLVEDAMNYIGFDQEVVPNDTFFVGFGIANLQANERLAVYQSLRENGSENTMFVKQNNQWEEFVDANSAHYSASLAFELVACNVVNNATDTPAVNIPVKLEVFPNPTNEFVVIDISEIISKDDIQLYDMLGRQVDIDVQRLSSRRFKMAFRGSRSGVYFLRIQNKNFRVSRKISYLPK